MYTNVNTYNPNKQKSYQIKICYVNWDIIPKICIFMPLIDINERLNMTIVLRKYPLTPDFLVLEH